MPFAGSSGRSGSTTPPGEPIFKKIRPVDYVGDPTPHANHIVAKIPSSKDCSDFRPISVTPVLTWDS